MYLLAPGRIDPVRKSPRIMTYGFFTQGTDPHHYVYSSYVPVSPAILANRLPRIIRIRRFRSHGFHHPHRYYSVVRLLARHRFPLRFTLIRALIPTAFPGTVRVLLESRTDLPRRAVRTHLGSMGG